MRPIISPEYAALNRRMHDESPDYGTMATGRDQDVTVIGQNATANRYATILDFGCGKGVLKQALSAKYPNLTVLEYDPAISGKDVLPNTKVDFVVCLDVLEHVEPDRINAVLEAIQGSALRLVMLKIALKPSKRNLPDGRNAHILLKPPTWWRNKLGKYFKEVGTQTFPEHLIFFGTPKGRA